uniref:Uncharacterized protein n=1 Tax=Rhizophora mucronata TaxID=61149 RepID=A0A2P2R296_RHIMU
MLYFSYFCMALRMLL